MSICKICGEDKPFNKKDRDRRFRWCKDCAAMYEAMKAEKRASEKARIIEEENRKTINLLNLNQLSQFRVSFD